MSIQQDKYKALRSNSKTTLTNLAKKYGYGVPKSIKNLQSFGKRLSNYIEKIQYKDYQSGISKTISPKGLYKEYLKKSGLHDTSQSKQIYKDIKEFTKLSRNLQKHMDEIRLVMDSDRFAELKNIIGNKGTIKDYVENTPKFMLKYSPYEKIEEIAHKYSHKYVDEILIRKNCGLSEKEYNTFMKKFDSMPVYRRIQMNQIVYDKYYEEYEEMKQKGSVFDSYSVLNKIVNKVMKGDFQ